MLSILILKWWWWPVCADCVNWFRIRSVSLCFIWQREWHIYLSYLLKRRSTLSSSFSESFLAWSDACARSQLVFNSPIQVISFSMFPQLLLFHSDCSPLDSSHLHQASEASQTGQSAGALLLLSRTEEFLLISWDVFPQLEIWIFFAVSWWGLMFCLYFTMILDPFLQVAVLAPMQLTPFCILCSFLGCQRFFDFSLSAPTWQLSICAINLLFNLSVLLPSYQ